MLNADTWLKPPPLKNRPRRPVMTLSWPKRKGIAVLIVIVPTVIGLAAGFVLSLVIRWLGRIVQEDFGPLLTETWVAVLIVACFGIIGAYVGWRSLVAVLMYGALESEGKELGTGN